MLAIEIKPFRRCAVIIARVASIHCQAPGSSWAAGLHSKQLSDLGLRHQRRVCCMVTGDRHSVAVEQPLLVVPRHVTPAAVGESRGLALQEAEERVGGRAVDVDRIENGQGANPRRDADLDVHVGTLARGRGGRLASKLVGRERQHLEPGAVVSAQQLMDPKVIDVLQASAGGHVHDQSRLGMVVGEGHILASQHGRGLVHGVEIGQEPWRRSGSLGPDLSTAAHAAVRATTHTGVCP
mmetsp:Transcript_8969/g.29708  ORF Transcript_8969/g.29708 Transcript_8969/m.29708 type:complete len:238 (-) Transcript_8969:214-927(-)